MAGKTDRAGVWLLAIVMLAHFASRYVGSLLFENDWSFVIWAGLPAVFGPLWLLCLALVAGLVYQYQEKVTAWMSVKRNILIGLGALAVLLVLFRFDAPLFVAGSDRVADLAESRKAGAAVVYRWFEFGSVLIGHLFYRVLSELGLGPNGAGVMAWRCLSWLAAAFSLGATLRLSGLLTEEKPRRMFLAAILFFGPQSLLFFGFVGVEAVIIPVTLWFAVFALQVLRLSDYRALLALWGVLILGIILHVSSLYLLPAVVFITVRSVSGRQKRNGPAFGLALLSMIGLVAAVYVRAASNLELASAILLWDGKGPFLDYGIFNGRHIGDIVQALWLGAPIGLVVIYLLWSRLSGALRDPLTLASLLMTVGGIAVTFMIDPKYSIVLEFPRFLAYLTPIAILLAVAVTGYAERSEDSRATLSPLLAVASVLALISLLPAHIFTRLSENYLTNYLDKNNGYYRVACISLRDAFAFSDNNSKANEWQSNLRAKSPDYVNLEGSLFLLQGEETSEALPVLNQMIVRSPYWAEPRALLAQTHIQYNRPQMAKPQIDTCLLLKPYERTHLLLLFQYYRDTRDYVSAHRQLERALGSFPNDTAMHTQEMLLAYLMQDTEKAVSLADSLLVRNPDQAYPYWVKGRVADNSRKFDIAMDFYREFLRRAPEGDMQTPTIEGRVELLDSVLNRM
jgi:tetratricopeptide (TPR) repeat protein